MNSSYMQFFSVFLPITRGHGAQIPKRHYRSLKHHYKTLEFFFFFFKLDFEKIEFQNKEISLIRLKNGAKCCFFCPKRAFAYFVP